MYRILINIALKNYCILNFIALFCTFLATLAMETDLPRQPHKKLHAHTIPIVETVIKLTDTDQKDNTYIRRLFDTAISNTYIASQKINRDSNNVLLGKRSDGQLKTLVTVPGHVNKLKFNASESILAASTDQGTVYMWNISADHIVPLKLELYDNPDKLQSTFLEPQTDTVNNFFVGYKKYYYSESPATYIKLWDVIKQQDINKINVRKNVTHVEYNTNLNTLAINAQEKVLLWDIRTKNSTVFKKEAYGKGLSWNPENTYEFTLATFKNYGEGQVYDIRYNRLLDYFDLVSLPVTIFKCLSSDLLLINNSIITYIYDRKSNRINAWDYVLTVNPSFNQSIKTYSYIYTKAKGNKKGNYLYTYDFSGQANVPEKTDDDITVVKKDVFQKENAAIDNTCPICLGIYAIETGQKVNLHNEKHPVCTECRPTLHSCPICRIAL